MDKPYKNSGLFSDHYLSDKLPNFEVWQVDPSELVKVHDKIKILYQTKKDELSNLSESALEERFIRPVLRALGHTYEVQPTLTSTAEGMKKPDYAFFENEEVRAEAAKVSGKEEFFKSSLAIGEAKQWGRPLDKKLKTAKDPFEIQNPSLQMSRYLWLTGVKWGILTDGRFWRLYERETSKRIDIYYEIDLPTLLEQGTVEDFKYFYIFFRKEAFVKGPDELCLLDKIYQGSVDYREEVSDELKANVYQALRILAEGFLKNPANNLSADALQKIHDNSLVFLYRLLFILYAEHRDLLPMDNSIYRDSYSLYALKQEVAEKIDVKATLSQTMSHYHGKLKELFEVINVGNEELGVPPYNGGLFDPDKHPFLEEYRVGDSYLAQVIDLLSRSSDKAFVDYSSLEIRHLGSIYEGLLEYKVKIANEDMVAIKEKGKEKWIPVTQAKESVRIFDEAKQGEIYLTTDKGERKATGSYYTPDYIVKYIVENTVGPLINEKKKLVEQKVEELREKAKSSRGYNREQYEKQLRQAENSLIDEILCLKVLDPAMGSGHFLVEATDFIARALVGVLSGEVSPEEKVVSEVKETASTYSVETMEEEDIRWARREVIERCIFGVDLNPLAVELAKLSLWLSTVAKDKPLSFLDHHLRCGNSLIGAQVDDLASLPEVSKKKKGAKAAPAQASLFEPVFKEKVNLMLKSFALLEKLPSDTVEQIREKEKYYEEFRKHVQRFKEVADIWASTYFGNEVSYDGYINLQMNLRATDEEWEELRKQSWFEKAAESTENKKFFHWELEFPEVFFEGHQRKENPGFDAVIGNPPYLSSVVIENAFRNYFMNSFETAIKRFDLFGLFCEQGLRLLRNWGTFSMILPYPMLSQNYSEKLREIILRRTKIREIFDLSCTKVFDEAIVRNCVLVLEKEQNENLCTNNVISILVSQDAFLKGDLNISKSRISQKAFLVMPKFMFRLDLDEALFRIFQKMESVSFRTSALYYIARGAVLHSEVESKGKDEYIFPEKKNQNCKPYIEGQDIERYTISPRGIFVEYVPSVQYRPAFPELFENEKILIYKVTGDRGLIIAYDDKHFYNNESLYNCIPKFALAHLGKASSHAHGVTEESVILSRKYNLKYILAVLNTKLLNLYYQKLLGYELNVYPDDIKNLPIRRVDFKTPEREANKFLSELEAQYEENNLDRAFESIEQFLPKGVFGKEKSDLAHDFLAYLAEQMIQMNKEKQDETKGFLEWLEREIGAKIDDLNNKTKIKAYHEHSFGDLLAVLKQNEKKLKVDPSNRNFQENLKAELERSLAKLGPLKSKIQSTDDLIDQIVYKLYSLTEEEINIVEESGK